MQARQEIGRTAASPVATGNAQVVAELIELGALYTPELAQATGALAIRYDIDTIRALSMLQKAAQEGDVDLVAFAHKYVQTGHAGSL